jgi:hypothetical protein
VLQLDVALTPRLLAPAPVPPVVVLVDVLRATSTATTLFALGARAVEVAGSLRQARARAGDGRVVCAERWSGRPAPGSGLSISPSRLVGSAVAGRAVVLCTTNGTRALRRVAPRASQVLLGCLLNLSAAATDAGVGLGRITFSFDGGQEIRNYTDALVNDTPVGLAPWQGSGKLALGPHTVEVTALDKNGNTATQTIQVTKVATLAATLTPTFKVKTKKIKCKKRLCSIAGSLSRASAASGVTPSIGGKVAVEWQFRNKKGKWRKLVGGLKPANKPFTFKAKLKLTGRWRVRLVYLGQAPWRKTSSKYLTFTVR